MRSGGQQTSATSRGTGWSTTRGFRVWFPLALYAVTRAINAVYFAVMQTHQIAMGGSVEVARVLYPTPAAPGYFVAMANWDGQWYHEISDLGYPVPLPTDPDGAVVQNPWAFYPVFPLLTRAVMRVTGADFYVAGSTLSLVVGAVAMVLLFRLVDDAVGRWPAIVATTMVTTYVAAPVLQTTYTESCALLLVVLVLTLLRKRQYWWAGLALITLALTRNIVLAMAPVVITHAIVRWRARHTDPFPMLDRILVGALGLMSVLLTYLWPTIARFVTGDPEAYTKTMAAWRVIASEIKLHTWIDYVYADYGPVGWLVAAAVIVGYARFMLSPHAWRWGPELWGWAGAYPAYQVLVTGIGPSRVRYFLLAFPVWLVLAWLLERDRVARHRVALLVALGCGGVALQGWWIWNYWMITDLTGEFQFP